MKSNLVLVLVLGLIGSIGVSPSADVWVEGGPVDEIAASITYYVRPDGGSPDQCTGLADAPYPGSGTDQPCAWDHPFRALQPSGEPDTTGFSRIAGGETLIITSGSYRMGLGAPGAENCDAGYPWDCHMPPVPGGPDPDHPTRILGQGWDLGCPDPPELWGTERAEIVLNLTDASNVEIACLEITDHEGCVEWHPGDVACERETYPYGDWAPTGLYAEDATHVRLEDLDIHGLAHTGIWAGRLTDWTVEDVRIAGNGWVGWDGDLPGADANSGALVFRRWIVEWNGCGETYPGGAPVGCWAQSAGGYGDGVGTGPTGGTWIIEDSTFRHNTSDGLDLLYHTLGGSVTVRRTLAEGNAGDQIKTAGPTRIENVIAVSDCSFFEHQSFTYAVDPCRAGGSALAFTLHAGDVITVVNSTVTGEGDCLIIAECAEGGTCDGTERVGLRNDIFLGNPQFGAGEDTTCLAWTDLSDDLFAIDHALIDEVKGTPDPCPLASLCDIAPGLADQSLETFDAPLTESSPAIDAGTSQGAPVDDFAGRLRDARPDLGAYEQWEPVTWIYVPLILKAWTPPPGASAPQVAGCEIFPANNIWNTPVDTLPTDANSDTYVATIGAGASVHADFGSGTWEGGPIGIPYVTVPGTQPRVPVAFDYAAESDPGPYPIPPDAPIEGGPESDGDRHVLVLARDTCILYELFYAWPQPDGSWEAGSGAIFDLEAHALRPDGWTSADAAGLPILPGLVRYDEVAEGEIRHALRFTAPQTRDDYVWPARHAASTLSGAQYPPLGQRFRLKAEFDESDFSPDVQVILRALKTYGMILADNGSAWYLSGVPDARWDNDALHALHQVHGSNFEAVDVSSLRVDPDSGQVQER